MAGRSIESGSHVGEGIAAIYAHRGGCVLSVSHISTLAAWGGAPPPNGLAGRSAYSLNGDVISQIGWNYSAAPQPVVTAGASYQRYTRTLSLSSGAELSSANNAVTTAEVNAFQQVGPIQNTIEYHRNRSANGHLMNDTGIAVAGNMTQAVGASFYAAGFDTRTHEAIYDNGDIFIINGDNVTANTYLSKYSPASQAFSASVKIQSLSLTANPAYIAGISRSYVYVMRKGNFDNTVTTTAELLRIPRAAGSIKDTLILPVTWANLASTGVRCICDRFVVAPSLGFSIPIYDADDSFNTLDTITLAAGSGTFADMIGPHHVLFASGGQRVYRIAA